MNLSDIISFEHHSKPLEVSVIIPISQIRSLRLHEIKPLSSHVVNKKSE